MILDDMSRIGRVPTAEGVHLSLKVDAQKLNERVLRACQPAGTFEQT
jgi:hypothetical protein